MSTLDAYKAAEAPLPESFLSWPLYGSGFENVGRDGNAVPMPLRPPADNEMLLRIDAVGVCASDIKLIRQGGNHARLYGRDLSKDPAVPGHEVSTTVVAVGKDWTDQFNVGDRHAIQADIFVDGVGDAFGYAMRGGQAEYAYVDQRALAGDEGCYLLPVDPELGYSQAALTEPWACVEMSYVIPPRTKLGDGLKLLVSRQQPEELGFNSRDVRHMLPDIDLVPLQTFDTIVVTDPDPEMVTALAPCLNPNGLMILLGKPAHLGLVTLDIGAIHYAGIRVLGGGDTLDEISAVNTRTDLLPGGAVLVQGGGGPMGQMHVQRALQAGQPPALVVVTGRTRPRLEHIERRFQSLADERGIRLVTAAYLDFPDTPAFNEHLHSLAPKGYSDVVTMAPDPRLVEDAVRLAAPGAVLNVFAGIAKGTPVALPLDKLCTGITLIGTSGSRIADMRSVLDKIESGQLNTDLSVAAIAGLDAALDALKAGRDGAFAGKTVVYPQIRHLPLMGLEELPERLPEVAALLSSDGAWTSAAEQRLLELHLKS